METNAMKRPLIILQARMSSTRLPGKSLLPLFEQKSTLELMLERVTAASTAGPMVVATTVDPSDAPIAELCDTLGVRCFRGSLNDVLDRYYRCAEAYGPPDAIVRLTADCPLHDAAVIDSVVDAFAAGDVAYASNVEPPTYPDGLDVEVFRFDALEAAWREAEEREHVTTFIRRHHERFPQLNVRHAPDLSRLRWTLDEAADLAFIRAVYAALYPANPFFGMDDVMQLLQDRPELAEINRHIPRNGGKAF
jgi:spore coat polysaccharide biosynthesis protein SpsF (cytidylyltransferase family)